MQVCGVDLASDMGLKSEWIQFHAAEAESAESLPSWLQKGRAASEVQPTKNVPLTCIRGYDLT